MHLLACAMVITATQTTYGSPDGEPFDTDSELIGIDNRCSGCISHVRSDFVGDVVPSRRVIKGFGGARTFNVWTGTIKWSWEDDQGMTHRMLIPNSYYVPDGQLRLLSPQHWVQKGRTGKDKLNGAGKTTTAIHTTLFWGNCKFTCTVPINRSGDNVATFRMSTGFDKFNIYCTEADMGMQEYDKDPLTVDEVAAFDAGIVSDDKDKSRIAMEDEGEPIGWHSPPKPEAPRTFDLYGPATIQEQMNAPVVIPNKEDQLKDTPTAELLCVHYDFGHLPFRNYKKWPSKASCQSDWQSAMSQSALHANTPKPQSVHGTPK